MKPPGRTGTGTAFLRLHAWILALRPKTLTAAFVPVCVATALVKGAGYPVLWWVSLCALFSALCIQIGTNFVNDALDFKMGADTEHRIGPQRVTQSGLMTEARVMKGAALCFLAALLLGIPLVVQGGWPIVLIGALSLLFGYGYTGGPFPLAYKGLGDFFVILFFGLIAVGGTFYLHTGTLSVAALVAGSQIGLLATVLIAVNNLRDAGQDALANKKTLVVRFGVGFARVEIAALIVGAFLLGAYWMRTPLWIAGVMPLALYPLAKRLLLGVFRNDPGPIYNSFLGTSAKLHLLFGFALAVALWVGPFKIGT